MPRKQQNFDIKLLGGEFATHMSCQDTGCQNYAKGWLVVLDVSNSDHAAIATWIKNQSGRRFSEYSGIAAVEEIGQLIAEGELTPTDRLTRLLAHQLAGDGPRPILFRFPPGQQCFTLHEDREVLFHHRQGESKRVHTRPLDFNEDFNIEADKINRALQRG